MGLAPTQSTHPHLQWEIPHWLWGAKNKYQSLLHQVLCRLVQTNVVERRVVNSWFLVWIYGLHQIYLHLKGTCAHDTDVFVNVFTLTLKRTSYLQAQHVNPQGAQLGFI
jgi:hypothetical protein